MANKSSFPLTSPLLSLIFRIILGSIFLYAGIMKIPDPDAMAQAIYNYRLLPGWMIPPAAMVMPWVEVLVGASLLLGIFAQGGALAAAGLLGLFACALAISLIRGLDISCGCFNLSSSAKSITIFTLLRDMVLLAMAIQVFFFQQNWRSTFSRRK